MITWGYDEGITWEYGYNMTYNMNSYGCSRVQLVMAMVMDKSWV